MASSTSHFSDIVSKFIIQGSVKEVIPWGNGNINDTYRVINQESHAPDYILQRVNENVFHNVEQLMENQMKVIHHVSSLASKGSCDVSIQDSSNNNIFQPPIQRKKDLNHQEGKKTEKTCYLYKNEKGWWRVSQFALNYQSYEQAPNVKVAKQAGGTIGSMILALSTFQVETLFITIPDFHNIHKRMEQLNDACSSNTAGERTDAAQNIMLKLKTNAPIFLDMYDNALSGAVPLRATHNDTKFNNMLFHPEKNVGIVIDLDTFMPGYSFFDIGDAVRSGMISADEDEPDLEKVKLNKETYHAFLDAFVTTAKSVLTPKEISYLPYAGAYMSFVLGVRFLTDYLNGDIYFKTKYPTHNLVRARCQFKVCDVFLEDMS